MRICNSKDKDLIVVKPKPKTFLPRKEFNFLRPCKSKDRDLEKVKTLDEPEIIYQKKFVNPIK